MLVYIGSLLYVVLHLHTLISTMRLALIVFSPEFSTFPGFVTGPSCPAQVLTLLPTFNSG